MLKIFDHIEQFPVAQVTLPHNSANITVVAVNLNMKVHDMLCLLYVPYGSQWKYNM